MARWTPLFVAATLAMVCAGTPGVRAFDQRAHVAGLEVRDPVLHAALARIQRGSASWRTALAAVAAAGRRVVVLTPPQVTMLEAGTGRPSDFDASVVAETAPVVRGDGRVDVVLVVVNLEVMQALHERRGSLPAEFEADVDRVLAHEIYGHAVPYLLSGHVSGRCADPTGVEPATAACAIQRENVVRAELRLGRRTDGALLSLDLARPGWR